MELKKFDVQGMNTQEMHDLSGGGISSMGIGAGIIGASLLTIMAGSLITLGNPPVGIPIAWAGIAGIASGFGTAVIGQKMDL